MTIDPMYIRFGGGVTIVNSDPADVDDDHASEGEDVAAEREPERDDTEQFERTEARVFERWLRRFGKSLDYWIWSGER